MGISHCSVAFLTAVTTSYVIFFHHTITYVTTTLFCAIKETLSATFYRSQLTYRLKLTTPHARHGHMLTLLQHPSVTLIPSHIVYLNISVRTWTVQSYLPGCASVHRNIIRASLSPSDSTPQTACRSVRPLTRQMLAMSNFNIKLGHGKQIGFRSPTRRSNFEGERGGTL